MEAILFYIMRIEEGMVCTIIKFEFKTVYLARFYSVCTYTYNELWFY